MGDRIVQAIQGINTPVTFSTPTVAPTNSYLHNRALMEGKELSYYPSCVIISNKLNETSNENVYFTEDEFESSPIIPTTLPTNPLYCLDTLRTTSPPTYSDLK